MRKIPAALKQRIEDAQLEGWTTLPAQILEKDVHITDALHAIGELDWRCPCQPSRLSQKPLQISGKLVFAGGTCLSKAYRLIERMSEDIDIKVCLDPVPDGYKHLSARTRLKALHNEIIAALTQIGFTVAVINVRDVDKADAGSDLGKPRIENPHVRDARRYFHLTLDYQSAFDGELGALRPNIKIELIHRPTLLASEIHSFGYLVDQMIGMESTRTVTMDCISVQETLAEKVLSMLRRTAWKWYGGQRGDMDPALVRHIYDVGRIASEQPATLPQACDIFSALVAKDAEEFGRQYREFAEYPKRVLLQSLRRLAKDEAIAKNYEQRLTPLVYGALPPAYVDAYATFADVAGQMLATLKH